MVLPPPWVRKAGVKSLLGSSVESKVTVVDNTISKMGVESSKWVVNFIKVYSLVNRTLSNMSILFILDK